MEDWYKIRFPFSQLGLHGKAMKLQTAYKRIFIASGGPPDAFVLASHEPALADHWYYFSPGAMRIAGHLIRTYGATTCPQPELHRLKLLVGDLNALDQLCSEEGSS